MIDRFDIWLLLVWFATSFGSMGAIYLTVRAYCWSRKHMFSYTWIVWLTWLLSSYLVMPAGMVVLDKSRLLPYQSMGSVFLGLLIGGFIVGTLALTIVASRLFSIDVVELQHAGVKSKAPLGTLFQQALAINTIAWLAAVAGLVIAGFAFNVYERFYPQELPFGIY